MDRLSDFKLATGDVLKGIGPARRRAASSCNAFAIATFSSISELCNELYDDDVVFTAGCGGLVCNVLGTEESSSRCSPKRKWRTLGTKIELKHLEH